MHKTASLYFSLSSCCTHSHLQQILNFFESCSRIIFCSQPLHRHHLHLLLLPAMGCSSSRMNSVEEVVPEKIRPLFFRRYEELIKRRQRLTAAMHRETTLSKKKLLKEDEDIHSNANSSDEAEAEFKPAVSSPRRVEPTNKVAPLPEPDTEYEAFTNTENQNGNTKQTLQEKEIDIEADNNDKDTQEAEEPVEENEHEQEEEENDDDDDDDFDFGSSGLVCPGSPSFRIYCLPPQNDSDESNIQQGTVTNQKSNSVESVQSPASGHVKTPSVDSTHSATSSQNSKNLNESGETQSSSKRRRNRRRKLRAVKNILVAKSLYASCSCAGSDRNRPVASMK